MSWNVINKQRRQVGRICMEIESLRCELRDDPQELISELEGIKAMCEFHAKNAAKRFRYGASAEPTIHGTTAYGC